MLHDLIEDLLFQGHRGQNAGAVPAVDTGLFDMLHDAPDNRIMPIGNSVHIYFNCPVQKTINQDGFSGGCLHRGLHIVFQITFIVYDLHGAPP